MVTACTAEQTDTRTEAKTTLRKKEHELRTEIPSALDPQHARGCAGHQLPRYQWVDTSDLLQPTTAL